MQDSLQEQILKAIDVKDLSPLPRWHFLLKRNVFWAISILAVVLGGVAVAIIIFVFFDHDFGARNYINQSLVDDILLTIPYLWLSILALLILIARLSFRYTKKGYRYGALPVISIILLISIILGVLLNAFDWGDTVNEYLNETIPYYEALVYTSKDEWTAPQKGLLGGVVKDIGNGKLVSLTDFKHVNWTIDVSLAESNDRKVSLHVGDMVKLVGRDLGNHVFSAEQVFFWEN